MSVLGVNPLLLGGVDGDTVLPIQRSVRLRSSASAYFNRTFTTPTSTTKWTFSGWVKRGSLGGIQTIAQAGTSSTFYSCLYFDSLDRLAFQLYNSGYASGTYVNTSAVFRDPSGWYHIVFSYDSTNATAANRILIYVNGVSQAITINNQLPQNTVSIFNSAVGHAISYSSTVAWGGTYLDGYLTEVNFIDGQVLTPSSFGFTNATTGVWQPKQYIGTYGNNGTYLPFKDNSSLDSIGFDFSSSGYALTSKQGTPSVTYQNNSGTYAAVSTAFDGFIGSSYNSCVGCTGTATLGVFISKDWGSGVTKTITAFKVIGSIFDGIGFNSGTATTTVNLQGSTNGSTWVDLYVSSPNAASTQSLFVNSGITTTTAYRYHRVLVYENSSYGASHVCVVGEIELYEAGTAGLKNWTSNGISLTSGATYDSMIDTPTPYSDGGNNRGNYPVMLVTAGQGSGAYSDGNLGFKSSTLNQWKGAHASIFMPSGKFYFEATIQALSANNYFMIGACGIQTTNTLYANYAGQVANGWSVQCNGATGGTKYNNNATLNVSNASFASWVAGDTLQCAVDVDNGRIWFGRNNVWLEGSPSAGTGASYTNLTGAIAPSVAVYSNGTDKFAVNFGQRPFAYTPPTGFVAINTYNLPDSTIPAGNKYFDIITWTGNGATGRSLSGLNFQPDFVWGKARDLATGNNLVMDSVRGSSKSLISNSTSAELTDRGISTFNANGFTLDSQTATRDEINPSGKGMVAWNWKAGSSAVTNTSGSITSQVNANTSAGFSIVTYTGTGANATVGHGLGVAPRMVIVKYRNVLTSNDWNVYHASLGATQRLFLNLTSAAQTSSLPWNNTTPTSTVFSIGTGSDTNNSATNYVAYCFSEVAGYSRFGVYTGNGALDGPFIYLGFKARYVLLKRTDAAGYDWWIYDTVRNTFNSTSLRLTTNSSVIEAGTAGIDICANGFKHTQTDISVNANGGTYIYAAFAENPFKNSLAR